MIEIWNKRASGACSMNSKRTRPSLKKRPKGCAPTPLPAASSVPSKRRKASGTTNEEGRGTHYALRRHVRRHGNGVASAHHATSAFRPSRGHGGGGDPGRTRSFGRSEEHTSELQSL